MSVYKKELEFALYKLRLRPEDIVFIGTRGGKYGCTYDELIELFEDMEDYGIRDDLVILFKDNSYLYRQEGPYHDDNGYTYWEREFPLIANTDYTKLDIDSLSGEFGDDLEEGDGVDDRVIGYELSWANSCKYDDSLDEEDEEDED